MDYETNSMQGYENYLTFANLSAEKKYARLSVGIPY